VLGREFAYDLLIAVSYRRAGRLTRL
jgi:hypothetical protein